MFTIMSEDGTLRLNRDVEYDVDPFMIDSLERYLNDRIPTGGFLEAVLSNDLMGAFNRADSSNLRNMENIMRYMYNHFPRGYWGSREVVRAHLAGEDL